MSKEKDLLHPSKSSSPSGRLGGALGIYIHIPFCKQACHYCDFHFSTSLKKRGKMVSALAKEIELRKSEFKNTSVETIYFGGGTPSVLTIDELRFLIETVYKNYSVSDSPEITLEANPDDLVQALNISSVTLSGPELSGEVSKEVQNKSIFQSYRDIGINRLSIGIQSFFEEDLKLMNRAHNAEEAKACLTEVTRYFDNISLDLIYGIPNSGNDKWLQNIETALSFGVPHISSYALTVEPKTTLKSFIDKGLIADVDEVQAEEQFFMLKEKLEEEGFVHYELSNFGKEGFFSKNNSSYWQGKSYIGIGPSAHSFNGKERSWNVRNNSKYIASIEQGSLPAEQEMLSITDRYNEYVMTGLRTIWGVSLDTIEERFGKNYRAYILQQAEPYIQQQLLYLDGDKLFVSKKGQFLSDGIASELFKLNLS